MEKINNPDTRVGVVDFEYSYKTSYKIRLEKTYFIY